jgi:hypothetical protein
MDQKPVPHRDRLGLVAVCVGIWMVSSILHVG